jgi:hypothetical protein
VLDLAGLVNIEKTMERSTITMLFMGKSTNFLWPFSTDFTVSLPGRVTCWSVHPIPLAGLDCPALPRSARAKRIKLSVIFYGTKVQ